MSLPRYSEYKDSGVEWLGEVPGHWEVKRLKQACHVFPSNVDKKSYDDETPVSLCNYTDVYYNETITADMEFMAATATDDQIAKFTLRAGDTIITKDSETADDIAIGAYVPADMPGVICGYHLSMIRPMTDTNGAFVKRLFDSTYVRSCVAVRANGLTRVGLGQYEIDNLELPFPPPEEQQTIAAFLDRETGKIDALIAEQRRLVELLAEKRLAVISHAVTKGLNPNAKMKDSGIEWLGEVPEHWAVCALGYLATIQTGSTPDRSKPDYWEGEIPWLKTGEINYELILDSEERITEAGLQNSAAKIAEVGTLMMAMYGQGITRGRVAILGIRAAYNQACAAITPSSKLFNEYAKYFFVMAYRFIRDTGNETSQMNLGSGVIAKIKILTPPIEEQRAIAAFLDTETAKFAPLTAEANRVIALLQERRSALISAAVTGKIDVRISSSPLSQTSEGKVLRGV